MTFIEKERERSSKIYFKLKDREPNMFKRMKNKILSKKYSA